MGAFVQAAFGAIRHDVSTWNSEEPSKEVYWEFYWGINQEDATKHSPMKKFTNFDEMKKYSSEHASEHSWIDGYWSSYNKITVE